jgi:hypothetical protein
VWDSKPVTIIIILVGNFHPSIVVWEHRRMGGVEVLGSVLLPGPQSLADPSDLEGTPTNRAGRDQPKTERNQTGPRTQTNGEGWAGTGQRPAQNWRNKGGGHPTCVHLV